MTHVLVLMTLSEDSRQRYRAFFRDMFPDVAAHVVGHRDELTPHIATADVLMSFGKPLGPEADKLLARAARLRWVQCLGTGVDNLADLPSLRREVVLTNVHAAHGPAVSEATLAFMLALARDLPRVVRSQDRRDWDRWPANLLCGKTVGIFGVGNIAAELAPKCKTFGMKVAGITSTLRDIPGFDRMHLRGEFLKVVGGFDFLVLLVPYTADLRHVIDARALAAMKPSAYLINVARGGLVDESALAEALNTDRLAGAASDVFETEPLPSDHPLWSAKNFIITTHSAGNDVGYDTRVLAVIERNMRCFLARDTAGMLNVVAR